MIARTLRLAGEFILTAAAFASLAGAVIIIGAFVAPGL